MSAQELSAVARTAYLIASARMVDSDRQAALVRDSPLSAVVPDTEEVRTLRQAQVERLQRLVEGLQQGKPHLAVGSRMERADTKDTLAVSVVGLRCRYVDDELLAALHGLRRKLAARLMEAGEGGGHRRPNIQVVMLGAGLDTRPWRLHLGHDISWFEVDLPDMAAFKRDSMERAGLAAEAPADCNADLLASGASAVNGQNPAVRAGFPLRVASWAAVAADLGEEGWVPQLEACGFDPGLPTIWVAEGLLYYLPQAAMDRLLHEVTTVTKQAGLGAAILTSPNPAAILASSMLREQSLAAAAAAGKPASSVWPSMTASLGFEPCMRLREAGWASSWSATFVDLELMYRTVIHNSTPRTPELEAIRQRAENHYGGMTSAYHVATATMGM
ncbi:hypothetical protein N2152v2_001227 [Parachlorella kessleri]